MNAVTPGTDRPSSVLAGPYNVPDAQGRLQLRVTEHIRTVLVFSKEQP
jgi:hypothetical protein